MPQNLLSQLMYVVLCDHGVVWLRGGAARKEERGGASQRAAGGTDAEEGHRTAPQRTAPTEEESTGPTLERGKSEQQLKENACKVGEVVSC